MTQSQRRANSTSAEKNRSDTMVRPPHSVVKRGYLTWFAASWNYPHAGGTRPRGAKVDTTLIGATISSGIGSLLSVMASHVRSATSSGADARIISPRVPTEAGTNSGEHQSWQSGAQAATAAHVDAVA